MDADQGRELASSPFGEAGVASMLGTGAGRRAAAKTDVDVADETAGATADGARLRRPSQVRARSRGPASLYDRMGGAVALRRLVRRFHELMETVPEAAEARAVLHVAPADLGPKLYEFLSGWLGGPDLYTKRHGAPKLKRRHFLVPIGPAQRDGWLHCFRQAAAEAIADEAARAEILPQIESLAHYLAQGE